METSSTVLTAAEGNYQGGRGAGVRSAAVCTLPSFSFPATKQRVFVNANGQGNSQGQELALVLQAFWAEGCIRNERNWQPCHPYACTACLCTPPPPPSL